MRAIKVALLDDGQALVTPEKVYMGEHRAARLEISLPARLQSGFDYYNLCFDVMGAGKRVPLGNIYEAEPDAGELAGLAKLENGVITCELPESLTQCSYLRAQVEACCEENGLCTRLEKSAPFAVAFEDAVAGEGDALSALALGHMDKLMARLNRLRRTLRVEVQGAQEVIGPCVARAEQAADRAEQAAADALELSVTPGPQGPQGPQGPAGAQGAQGPKGDKGDKGDRGEKGVTGAAGATGPVGAQGAQGPKGEKGDTGPTGPQGPQGQTGTQGAAGPQGESGAQGPTGPQGAPGVGLNYADTIDLYAQLPLSAGQGDAYFVLADGLLYIHGSAGFPAQGNGAPIQGPQGIQGLTGPQGETGAPGAQGPKGDTGAAGPQGAKGDKGDTGAAGAAGATGAQGPQGQTGSGVPAGGASGQVLAKASGADRDTEWIDPPEGGGGGGVTVISSFAEIESAGTPLAIADNQYTVIDWIPAAGLNGIQDPPVTIRALETISPQQLPQPPQNTATIYNAAGDRWMLNNEPALGGVVFTVTPAGQVAAGFYYIYDGGLFSQVTGIQINTGWNKMVSGNPIQFDPCTAEDVGTIDAANIQGTYNLLEFTCQAQIKTEYKAGLYAKIAGKWALVGPGA